MNIFKIFEMSGYIIGGAATIIGSILIFAHLLGKNNLDNNKLKYGSVLAIVGVALIIYTRFQLPELQEQWITWNS